MTLGKHLARANWQLLLSSLLPSKGPLSAWQWGSRGNPARVLSRTDHVGDSQALVESNIEETDDIYIYDIYVVYIYIHVYKLYIYIYKIICNAAVLFNYIKFMIFKFLRTVPIRSPLSMSLFNALEFFRGKCTLQVVRWSVFNTSSHAGGLLPKAVPKCSKHRSATFEIFIPGSIVSNILHQQVQKSIAKYVQYVSKQSVSKAMENQQIAKISKHDQNIGPTNRRKWSKNRRTSWGGLLPKLITLGQRLR